jgi:hypothetical protein
MTELQHHGLTKLQRLFLNPDWLPTDAVLSLKFRKCRAAGPDFEMLFFFENGRPSFVAATVEAKLQASSIRVVSG